MSWWNKKVEVLFKSSDDDEEDQAILRLWHQIKPCLVLRDDYGDRKLDITASAIKWFWHRRTNPAYFRDHWQEYNTLAYKYLYPFLYLTMDVWAEEYRKIDKEPGSEEANKLPYILFEEAFHLQ